MMDTLRLRCSLSSGSEEPKDLKQIVTSSTMNGANGLYLYIFSRSFLAGHLKRYIIEAFSQPCFRWQQHTAEPTSTSAVAWTFCRVYG